VDGEKWRGTYGGIGGVAVKNGAGDESEECEHSEEGFHGGSREVR
jgi:hypothetical protein